MALYFIGIAGGSGSGKTTFAQKLISRLDDSSMVLLHMDSYYMAAPPEKHKIHGAPNFDHPGAFDWELLRDHLQQLKQGSSVEEPIYNFKISRREEGTHTVGPCKVVLLEGIFALWDAEIRNLLDLKIFLHVDSDIRFIRRLHRDVRERGRNIDNIIRQYYDTVRPMYHKYLDPTRQYADISVGDETDIAADVVSSHIKEVIFNNL